MIELNLPAKPNPAVKKELYDEFHKKLVKLGISGIFVDLMLLNTSDETIEKYLYRPIQRPQDYVDILFTWSDTPEGGTFWSNVYSSFAKGDLNPIHLFEE